MKDPSAPGSEAQDRDSKKTGEDPRQVIEQATSSVPLEALLKNGFKNVRVLSETRFLELLRDLVERSFQRRYKEWKARISRSKEPERRRLEAKHKESLRSIEKQMARLSRVFEGLEEAFNVLEETRSDGSAAAPAGLLLCAFPAPPGADKKKALLREMLLKKGK